ncbi:DinB/UmuC family translesion DNA polymerase [Chlorogloea sp. CCALA 695]|uniref:DinB/UmuC family translesion DNA polymerase n=1 Tax=Chlorogloea sp. CCALA 695 TaxID=2107693 RepID=UPI003514CAFA
MLLELKTIAQTVQHRLQSYQALGRTITLKVKFTDIQQITPSKTVVAAVGKTEAISQVAKELLAAISLEGRSVRLSS